jgi:hypothetical protein
MADAPEDAGGSHESPAQSPYPAPEFGAPVPARRPQSTETSSFSAPASPHTDAPPDPDSGQRLSGDAAGVPSPTAAARRGTAAPSAPPTGIRLESADTATLGVPEPPAPAAVPGEPADGPGVPVSGDSAPDAQQSAGPVPAAGAPTPQAAQGAPSDGVRLQPVPPGDASAVPPTRGLDKERAWLRRTFSAQFGALAGSVTRVMSESPGLRPSSREEGSDTLTDLVAVRLYLGSDRARVDAAVRRAAVGPHVPLARCVTAGLRRLPSYRGATLLHAPTAPGELAWYREGRLTTEWAFCGASTVPYQVPDDHTLFLIWSMTARRTRLLDPGAPGRVLFEPGTRFVVLRTEPGAPAAVLLRELSATEPETLVTGDDERRAAALNALALAGLEKTLAAVRGGEGGDVPVGVVPGVPPGLLPSSAADARRPRDDASPGPSLVSPGDPPPGRSAVGPGATKARPSGSPAAGTSSGTTASTSSSASSSTSSSTSSSKGARR